MPEANGTIVITDYANKSSTVGVNLQAADQGGVNAGTLFQDLDEAKDAIAPLVNGAITRVNFSVSFPETGMTAADGSARGNKWLVTMRDTTQYLDNGNVIQNPGFGKTWDFEIPCANFTLLDAGQDELSLSAGVGATFKAAIEPNVRSPWNRSAGAGVTPTQVCVRVKRAPRTLD